MTLAQSPTTLREFLAELSRKNIKLWAEDDQLKIRAPKGVLTPELRTVLAERKGEILAFLQQNQEAPSLKLPPLVRVSSDEPLPLTFAQERLWSLEQFESGTSVYNLAIALKLQGKFNLVAFEKSINEIIRRHGILRTAFEVIDENPVPQIVPTLADQLPSLDLQNLSPKEQEQEIQRIAQEQTQEPFDLNGQRLWRMKLLHLSPEEQVFILTMHHIISDGWSFRVFLEELSELYQAFSEGNPSPLAELPVQYSDFAHWQRQWLSGKVIEAQQKYWQQQLQGEVAPLKLPTQQKGLTGTSYQGDCVFFSLPNDLTRQLRALGEQTDVTLFKILLTAFNLLLHQYSRQTDLLVCSPVVGRIPEETEILIGYFNNILLMRTDLTGDPTIQEVLERVSRMVTEAYEHQDFPFQKLTSFPNLVRIPLTRAMFNLEKSWSAGLNLCDLTVSRLNVHNGAANFDLSLSMEENGDHLTGAFNYKTDLFSVDMVTEMVQSFQTLLESMVAKPEQSLSALPLLGEVNDLSSETVAEKEFVAPRDQWEKQLAQIWQKVLGLESVSVQDNFFDLGGHSLLAMRLFTEIEKKYGKRLPLATLAQSPTIELLARQLNPEAPTYANDSTQGLTTSQPPLFLIPPSACTGLFFTNLSRYIPSNQPIHGLDYLGMDGSDIPQSSVKQIAQNFVQTIQTIQPQGPYLIGGQCFGGIVAFEIAQQLRSKGQEVSFLGIIDTLNPPRLKRRQVANSSSNSMQASAASTQVSQPSEPKSKGITYYQQRLVKHIKEGKFVTALSAWVKYTLIHQIVDTIIQKAKAGNILGKSLQKGILPLFPQEFWINRTYAAHEKARDNYIAQIYPEKITIFQSTDHPPETLDKQMRWSRFSPVELDIYQVPGTHDMMWQEPQVQVLATELTKALSERVVTQKC